MRYSIMLQLVAATTFVLLGAAALFAWIQTRTESIDSNSTNRHLSVRTYSA